MQPGFSGFTCRPAQVRWAWDTFLHCQHIRHYGSTLAWQANRDETKRVPIWMFACVAKRTAAGSATRVDLRAVTIPSFSICVSRSRSSRSGMRSKTSRRSRSRSGSSSNSSSGDCTATRRATPMAITSASSSSSSSSGGAIRHGRRRCRGRSSSRVWMRLLVPVNSCQSDDV